jgi:peroxiredoxin
MYLLPSRNALLPAAAVALSLLCCRSAAAHEAAPVANFALTDSAGKKQDLYDLKGKKGVVAVFLSFECPVSNSYATVLAELHAKYGPRGIAFLGIDSSDDIDAAQAAKVADERKLPFGVFVDPAHTVANKLDAKNVPEVFVLDEHFVVRYRGRIDDGWSARLKKNTAVTRHHLADALDAVLAGRAVAEPVTKAIGCPIPRDASKPTTSAVTFYRDVLPILQEQCQQCHRPGEVGPFSLMTYKQAVNWASDIKEYTHSRKMPPWKPVAGAAFYNERKLSDKELTTLATWADGGTAEGDPKDAPPPRKFVDGWQLGEPDLVLTVPGEMTIGATGDDLFRCFVLPTHLKEDKYVVAFEVRPGNSKVVHHTLNFIDRSGQGRKLEQKEQERAKGKKAADFGPGYSVMMGVGFQPQGTLAGWAPGQLARTLPEGTGYPLTKDSDVVIQVHYHRTGKVEKDRTALGLYFAKRPVQKPFKGTVIRGQFWMIPGGDAHFRVRGGVELQENCRLYTVMPHMHKLGREIAVTVTPPGGKPSTLVAIKDWDYNWQETYVLKEPIDLKAGTKLQVEAFYDNSASNPDSPSHGRFPVFFGEQTTNEMCFIFLGATSDSFGRIRARPEGGRGGFRAARNRSTSDEPASRSRAPEKERVDPAGSGENP